MGALQQLIDGIDHVLHPDATVTKRDLVDIAHQIEAVIGEISKVLGPTTKRNIVDIANQIEGVLSEITKILAPTTKRGIIADRGTYGQSVVDGIDHVLHPDATV